MISTHVLDLGLGKPGAGVAVSLERQDGSAWRSVKEAVTDADGRIQFNTASESGTYRLTFNIEDYFKKNGQTSFFTVAPVTFHIRETNRKYHIPLLLNSFGYSTYRGT
jgi:5-hydroxyisourate hydrolase